MKRILFKAWAVVVVAVVVICSLRYFLSDEEPHLCFHTSETRIAQLLNQSVFIGYELKTVLPF